MNTEIYNLGIKATGFRKVRLRNLLSMLLWQEPTNISYTESKNNFYSSFFAIKCNKTIYDIIKEEEGI